MYVDDEIDDGSTKLKIEKVPGVIALDECCWHCNNDYRQAKKKPIDPNCDFCHGKGYMLTEAGKIILNFIERWK